MINALSFLNRPKYKTLALLCASAAFLTVSATHQVAMASPPALVISNEPLPVDLRNKVYSSPAVAPRTSAQKVMSFDEYKSTGQTVVGKKVDGLRSELFELQGKVADFSEKLAGLEMKGRHQSAEYYASVATISTQLQSGTTPGNPRLISKLNVARDNLEKLSSNIASLNSLAVDISGAASMSSFLLESSRATYALSGAIEEDHVRLAQLEDAVNNTVVVIERLLNNVNDDITRTSAYMATERDNLRTLSLAINTGDLFGKNLSNRPFSSVQKASFTPVASSSYGGEALLPTQPLTSAEPAAYNAPAPMASAPSTPRPLVKIRFDKQDVDFEQPVYMAVNEALNRYPNAQFELVAVHPNRGNAAEVAIESTRSRRNAERVLRSLTEMGLTMEKIDLSYTPSEEATTNEVHLYIR